MNNDQRDRLFQHLEPDHKCGPYRGGCGMPHFRHNVTMPHWIEQWPDYSPARLQAEEVRLMRDWGDDD